MADAVIPELRDAVRALVECVDDLHTSKGYAPEQGSMAAVDQARDADLGVHGIATPMANAYSVATVQLAAAGDFLMGVEALLEPGDIVTSAVLCARGALEASAQAWWLLDPAITYLQRAGRGAGALFETLRRKRLLPFVDQAAVDQRMNMILKAAEAMNLEVRRGKRGKVEGIGDRPPTATDLTAQLMASAGNDELDESLYRFYSAVAHATPLGLINLLKSSTDDSAAVLKEHRLSLSPTWQVVLLGSGLQGYGEAVERELVMYGWGDREFRIRRFRALRLIAEGLRVSAP